MPGSENTSSSISEFDVASLAFLHFGGGWVKISELGPENETPRRKFHGESDAQLKNTEFRCPGVKI